MRIVLRPGHGMTPPEGKAKPIDYSPGESGYSRWMRQRPGNREDDYVAKFCGRYLIPALARAGHCIYPQRALDPVTGQPDTNKVEVGPELLAGLAEDQAGNYPRWLYNASVEGAIRGSSACRSWAGSPWVYDPVASCLWEKEEIPLTDPKELYLSIHQNWFPSRRMYGCNVLYYGYYKGRGKNRKEIHSRAGKPVAEKVYGQIVQAFAGEEWAEETGLEWGRGRLQYRIKTGSRWGCSASRLWEVRKTRRPAVLIELAFASNPEDNDRMNDPDWCGLMAESIAQGISASD